MSVLGRSLFSPGSDEALGRLAVERGWVTPEQVAGGAEPLARRLLGLNLITPQQWLSLLAIQSGELTWCRACNGDYDPRVSAACPACSGGAGRIGRFTVVRELGRGGMGVVLEVRDPARGGIAVALKVVPEQEAGRQRIERLRREAELAARLRHPHIVQIHEAGSARDPSGRLLHYVAMDLVEGATLAQHQREGTLDRGAQLKIFRDICDAVAHAHALGILHRDLKPSNVLVETSGRAVLADLGLASDPEGDPMLTPSQAVMGTLAYMAPEQALGATKRIDSRTDVWGLGVMLYEILTGRLPFRARAQEKLLDEILTLEPPAPEGPLGPVCLKALSKEPSGRYRDAGELREALGRTGEDPLYLTKS